MSRMSDLSGQKEFEDELDALIVLGGPEPGHAFTVLRQSMKVAKALARDLFGKSDAEITMAVFDRFQRIYAATGKKRDPALDAGEASFEED